MNNTKDSLEFTQDEHDDLVERVANCENEQSTCWDELTRLNIYGHRWNLIFYRVNESKDEDCFSLVRDEAQDKKGGNPVWKKSIVIKEVQHLANLYNLTDIWRDHNPNDDRFTWRNK